MWAHPQVYTVGYVYGNVSALDDGSLIIYKEMH